MPDILKQVFSKDSQKTKSEQKSNKKSGPFNAHKNLDMITDSSNIKEEAMRKADALFQKLNIFKNVPVTAKQIAPLNNIILAKKEKQKQKELSAGRGWGEMPKQELTDEVKADLRAIQLRNHIFSNRFYKSNDSKKLPSYFQIGTVVIDKNDTKMNKLSKKE